MLAYIHTCIHTYTHTCIQACVCAYIHAYVRMFERTHLRAYACTYMHTYIRVKHFENKNVLCHILRMWTKLKSIHNCNLWKRCALLECEYRNYGSQSIIWSNVFRLKNKVSISIHVNMILMFAILASMCSCKYICGLYSRLYHFIKKGIFERNVRSMSNLVSVAGSFILVLWRAVKSLQLIWRSGTRRFHLRVPVL